jgi:SagB-type dehydrogenase family enzyme
MEQQERDTKPLMVAELYHQETKYAEREMGKHEKRLDLREQPESYKEYHSEQRFDLTPYLPFQNNIFTGEPLAPIKKLSQETPITRATLSRLLYFTNGVTGILRYPNGQSLLLRAAPTAGGLYPTEIYLVIRNCSYLTSGIYNFQVKNHSLVLAWEGDYWNAFEKYCMGHEAIGQSDCLILLTAVYERSTWRYSERAYRRILLDTGHVLGNLAAYAPYEGLTPVPMAGFFDASLNALLYLDPSKEGVLAVVALPQTEKIAHHEVRLHSAVASRSQTPTATDSAMLQLALHRISSIREADRVDQAPVPLETLEPEVKKTEPRIIFHDTPIRWPEGVGQTILNRRSTREFTGEGFLQEELSAILEYGYQPVIQGLASSSPSFFFTPSLLKTTLIVQKVIGLSEGIYQYDPYEKTAIQVRAGDFRNQTTHFCLGQELAKNSAALVIHLAHFPTALQRYGDRAYRYLHMDAGHIGERMNLAAIQMGLGVSGIGGFYDDEVNHLLGLSLDWIVVYITTLGRP